jgi:hypothetical protein
MTDRPRIVRADPIPDNIVDILRLEGQAEQGVSQYPDRLIRIFRRSRIANGLAQVADIVEPRDRVLGIDQSKPVAKAFRAGGLIGLRVAAACVDDIDRAFSGVSPLMPSVQGREDADDLETRHAFASTIIDIGAEAYAQVDGIFDPLFDEWEDLIVPDVRHQRVLRSGFGIPISYLSALDRKNQAEIRAADLAAMENQITEFDPNKVDWGAFFA